jgi:uncharacterized protein (TIGR02266 family)
MAMELPLGARPVHGEGEAVEDEGEAVEDEGRRSEATIRSVFPQEDAARRRTDSRFCVDLDVTVGSDHNFYAGFAENLSAGGVFIATHNLKPVGSQIELSINLPDGVQMRALGEVRWIRVFNETSDTPPGMGVKFMDVSDEAVASINSFLARRDPLFFDDE